MTAASQLQYGERLLSRWGDIGCDQPCACTLRLLLTLQSRLQVLTVAASSVRRSGPDATTSGAAGQAAPASVERLMPRTVKARRPRSCLPARVPTLIFPLAGPAAATFSTRLYILFSNASPSLHALAISSHNWAEDHLSPRASECASAANRAGGGGTVPNGGRSLAWSPSLFMRAAAAAKPVRRSATRNAAVADSAAANASPFAAAAGNGGSGIGSSTAGGRRTARAASRSRWPSFMQRSPSFFDAQADGSASETSSDAGASSRTKRRRPSFMQRSLSFFTREAASVGGDVSSDEDSMPTGASSGRTPSRQRPKPRGLARLGSRGGSGGRLGKRNGGRDVLPLVVPPDRATVLDRRHSVVLPVLAEDEVGRCKTRDGLCSGGVSFSQ